MRRRKVVALDPGGFHREPVPQGPVFLRTARNQVYQTDERVRPQVAVSVVPGRADPDAVPVPHAAFWHELVVYVVWHPQFAAGTALADRLRSSLARDRGGFGVPVFFRSDPDPGGTCQHRFPSKKRPAWPWSS